MRMGLLPAHLYIDRWRHSHAPVLAVRTQPHWHLVENTDSTRVTQAGQKSRGSFSRQLLQSICYSGNLKSQSGTLLLCSRCVLPKRIAAFRSRLPRRRGEPSCWRRMEQSSGGGALAWGPWVQRVISARPALRRCR